MKRAVRNLIRIFASAIVASGLILATLEIFRPRLHAGEIKWSQIAISAVLISAGIFLFVISAKLAAKWTDDFEE